MRVHTRTTNLPEIVLPGNTALPNIGSAQPSLKSDLSSVSNSLAAAEDWWREASSNTAADLRATMKEMSARYPLGKAQIALEEIQAENDREFRPQAAGLNLRSRSGALAGGLLAVTGMRNLLPSTPAMPPMPTGKPSVAPPMPDLKGLIDWRAFDEAGFLRDCGMRVGNTIPARLRGMYECFHPQTETETETKKLPLDTAQFDSAKVEQFVKDVMASTGYAQESKEPTDPAFSQHLFKRWFLQLAAPQAGNGDGNGGGDASAAPFHKDLLKLAHPDTPYRKSCGNGKDVAPLLPRIGVLKEELRTLFLKSYQRFDAESAYEWAFEGLCQLFEPTLVRRDLPEAFRYGSLAWAQLSIGIALAGDDHINLTLPELTSLAAVFDVFSGDPDDASLLAIRRNAMRAVLRMAHAHGKLDLSTLPEIRQAHLETAFAFYQSQLSREAAKLPPMEELVERLPTRRDIAKKMLRACGMRDDTRRFRAFNQHLHNHHGVALPNTPRESSCIPWGKAYALSEIYMMDCLPQMQWATSPLTKEEQALLQSPMLTHDELTQRFDQNFDAAWATLGREILAPALQDQIEFMDAGDEEFLRCGEVTRLGIPEALVETRFSGARRQGVIGVGAGPTEWIEHRADGLVLIELLLARGGKEETRSYLAKLGPGNSLELRRYEGGTKKLLKENLHHFFKAADGSSLVSLSERYAPAYTQYEPGGFHGDLLETISTLLLADRGESLRESARQTTEPEKLRAEIREMLLDLIPGRACINGLRANKHSAAVYCTVDFASLFPLVKAGKAGVSGIAALTRFEIANLGRALLFNSVEAGGRKTIETVFKLVPQAINFAKEGIRLFDPGIELAYRLNTLGFRLGKAGAQSLLKKMRHYDVLSPVAEIVEKGTQQAGKFYPGNGYWHARNDVIVSSNQGRYVVSGDRRYWVFDWGKNKNVLTTQAGDDWRLVNPQSGIGYGPLLRKSAVMGRLELKPRTRDAVRDVPAHTAALCRSKRAGGAAVCRVPLVLEPRFGDHAYAQEQVPPLMRSQLTGAGETVLRTVDLRDIGFEEFLLNSEQRWTPVAPVIGAQYDAATGSWKGIDAAVPLSDQLPGEVMDIPDKAGNPVSYVRVEFFSGNAEDDRMMHIRYLPFISYEDADGALMHHVTIGGRSYSFHWNREVIASDGSVALHLETAEERKKLAKYQALLHVEYKVAGIDFSSVVRLRDQNMAFRREFEGMMVSAETKLLDAIAVFETMPGLVRTICERFSNGDDAAVDLLISNIGARMRDMRDAFPYLIDQSGHAIGIFTNQAGRDFNRVEGAAIRNSMNVPVGFRLMENTMLFFNSRFCGEAVPLAKRIENFLHEWSHALTGTSDSPTGPGGPVFYAAQRAGRYDLAPLMEAARAPGGNPAQHAATLQHIIMMLANFRYLKTERLSHPFIYGKNFYFSGYPDFVLQP